MTPVLQPLDLSVDKPFEAGLQQEYKECVWNLDRKETLTGKLQKAALSTIARWISHTWKWVQVDVAKSFEKCSITNHFDGTEDDLLWDIESSGSSDARNSSGSEVDWASDTSSLSAPIFILNVCQIKCYFLRSSRQDIAVERGGGYRSFQSKCAPRFVCRDCEKKGVFRIE